MVGEKIRGLKLFDLGKIKGVSTVSELESMYVSGVPKYQENLTPTPQIGGKRNKYFNTKGGGSMMSDSIEESAKTPTLLQLDVSSEDLQGSFNVNGIKPVAQP